MLKMVSICGLIATRVSYLDFITLLAIFHMPGVINGLLIEIKNASRNALHLRSKSRGGH